MRKIAAIIICFLSVLSLSLAQSQIDIGDEVQGRLEEAGQTIQYAFTAEAGDVIVASLVSDEFDAFLRLLGPDGDILTTDDDSGGDRNALIPGYEIEADGTYALVVSSFDELATGEFTLSLHALAAIPLEYGDQVSDEPLPGVPLVRFTFEGERDDLIAITLETTGVGGFVELESPSGEPVGNSLYVDEMTTRLGPLRLPETGDYVLTVRTDSAFQLLLDAPEPIPVELGDEVTETLSTATGPLYFEYGSTRDQLVDFIIESEEDVRTRLDVIQPASISFTALTVDDNDPALDYTFVRRGLVYYVVVSPVEGQGDVNAEITLRVVETPVVDLDAEAVATVEFTEDRAQQHLGFEAEAGETYTLSVAAETSMPTNAQPVITITQGDTTLASVNPGGLMAVSMTFTVPDDGEVQVLVQFIGTAALEVALERGS